MHAMEMIRTHPHVKGQANEPLVQCIEECYDCAQSCVSCADACLGEEAVQQLTQCVRLNLDCADICVATGAIATRRTGSNEASIRSVLETCALACRLCGDECEKHDLEHCRLCAEACRRCQQACQQAAQSIGARH